MSKPPPTYAFPAHEKGIHGFKRVLTKIATKAHDSARHSRGSLPEAAHDCRLLIKRVRALLWFARPSLKVPAFAGIKRQLRGAAHLLTDDRDTVVTQTTVEKLAHKASKRRDRMELARTARSLAQTQTTGHASRRSRRHALNESKKGLLLSIEELKQKAEVSTWPDAKKRVEKAYRSMRHARHKAWHTGHATAFHRWRKKTKRLLYLLELDQHHPHGSSRDDWKKANRLQNKLGDHHDCVVAMRQVRQKDGALTSLPRTLRVLKKRKSRLEKKLRGFAF